MELLIIHLILGLVLPIFFTPTPFSVLAQTESLYKRPSLQDKTGEYAIVVCNAGNLIPLPPPPSPKESRSAMLTLSFPIPIFSQPFPTYNSTSFSFHQKGAPPSSTTTAQTHTNMSVWMQTPKSFPTTTAITE